MYQDLMGKRLLLLGGVNHAIEIVKAAQEMGVEVHVADYNEGTPAKEIADKAVKISTVDIDALEKYCVEEKIDGVITGFIDSMLPYCEELCRRLNFPFWANHEQIQIYINKDKFKETCREYKVPIAKEYKISYTEGFDESELENVEYPVIVKPVDNSGSRGVFACQNKEQLMTNYVEALNYSKSKTILVEQLLVGQHVNMYYTLDDGEIHLSAMADRYVDELDGKSAPLPVCLVHPSRYLSEYEHKVDGLVKNMFKDLKMENGVAFVQGFRCLDGSFVIYEMGYRLNGGATYSLIEACAGYNQLKMLIFYSLTGKMIVNEKEDIRWSPHFKNYGINFVLSVANGEIASIQGIEELKTIPGMKNVVQVRFEGDKVVGKGGSSQVIAYLLFTIDSLDELEEKLDTIYKTVVVKDQDGNELEVVRFDGICL